MQRYLPVLLVCDPEVMDEELTALFDTAIDWQQADIFRLTGSESIGIEAVREIIAFIQMPPYSLDYKIVVLEQAERLTIPAQHALLKTLEEHKDYVRIVLCTVTPDTLLETIRSRMILREVSSKHVSVASSLDLDPWLTMSDKVSSGERIGLIQPFSRSRPTAVSLILELLAALRRLAPSNPSGLNGKRLELLQETYVRLEGNAHVGLCMQRLMLHW